MRFLQLYLPSIVLLLCLVGLAPSQQNPGAQNANAAYDELGRLLKDLDSWDRDTRVAAEQHLHKCCELLTRSLVARASLSPDRTLLGRLEGRDNAGHNKDQQDATPALAMRLLGNLRTLHGIRDRLKHVDYVSTLSSYTRQNEGGLEWLMARPAAYSIFMLDRASAPAIVSYLFETKPEDVSQEQIDLLAKILASSYNNPIAALRVIRGSSAHLPSAEIATNLRRLDESLAALEQPRQ